MIVAMALAAALGPPALPLKPCRLQGSVSARCGTLAVPEDRRVTNGRKIKVFVGVIRAYGPRPHLPPVFWLAGGPGGAAATDDARFAQSVFLGANRKRDIVLVDQRGVGKSAPLLCPTVPADTAEAQDCLRKVRRDPRLYTTDPAMDDVDAVRKALGYSRIVLYGGSYGATAAQVYIARHGSRVAAAVLDGATLLDVPIWERMPRSTQDAFDAVAARCALAVGCHATFPDVAKDLRTALARLRTAPLLGGSFGIADAQGTVRYLLRSPEGTSRLPAFLHRAAGGDYSALVNLWTSLLPADRRTTRQLMYWAIRCAEGWSRIDPAEVARWGAGTQFLEASLSDAQTIPQVCALLGPPLPAPDAGVVPRSRVPVLFLVGGMDPQDPLANVQNAARSLPNAHVLVVPGAGHGAVHLGCLPAVATRFFSAHRLSSHDRGCAAAVQPPDFDVSPLRESRSDSADLPRWRRVRAALD